MSDHEDQGCAVFVIASAATALGFLLGFIAAVLLAAIGGW